MDKITKRDLTVLAKYFSMGFILMVTGLTFLGASPTESLAISFFIWFPAGYIMWFFIRPTLPAKENRRIL